jgi:nucleoside-diphosphate kinase
MIERSLILIKPDGVQRALVGEIISRFERVGLKMVGMKLVHSDTSAALDHYLKDDDWFRMVGQRTIDDAKAMGNTLSSEDALTVGKQIQQGLVEFISMSPLVAIVLEGHAAIAIVRKLVGSTYPLEAPPGTIRGDFSFDSAALAGGQKRSVQNLIHASGAVDEAEREIKIWFNDEELHDWRRVDEAIIYRESQ